MSSSLGVRGGLEHGGGIGGAEALDELDDAGALAVGQQREAAAQRHEVVLGRDERIELCGAQRGVADPDLARQDQVGDVEPGGGAPHAVAAARRVPAPEVRRQEHRDPCIHESWCRGVHEADDVVEGEGAADRFEILQRRPRALGGGPLDLDELGDGGHGDLQRLGCGVERELGFRRLGVERVERLGPVHARLELLELGHHRGGTARVQDRHELEAVGDLLQAQGEPRAGAAARRDPFGPARVRRARSPTLERGRDRSQRSGGERVDQVAAEVLRVGVQRLGRRERFGERRRGLPVRGRDPRGREVRERSGQHESVRHDAARRDVQLEQHAEGGRDRPARRDDLVQRVGLVDRDAPSALEARWRDPERLVDGPRPGPDDRLEVLVLGGPDPLVGIGEEPQLTAVEAGIEQDPLVGLLGLGPVAPAGSFGGIAGRGHQCKVSGELGLHRRREGRVLRGARPPNTLGG